MNRIPPEIHDLIVSNFSESINDNGVVFATIEDFRSRRKRVSRQLPSLATVSRQWQRAVEKETFRQLDILSTDLQEFGNFVVGDRRVALKSLRYCVILPRYDKVQLYEFEREADRLFNNVFFTVAIRDLFIILRAWEKEVDGGLCFDLSSVVSPSDTKLLQMGPLEMTTADEDRFRYSYLELQLLGQIPHVGIIDTFRIHTFRRFNFGVPADLLFRLPRVREATWFLRDDERHYLALRRSQRVAFSEHVVAILGSASSLEMLKIVLHANDIYIDKKVDMLPGDLRPPGHNEDPLCAALHQATAKLPRLQNLQINGLVDESLFGPGASVKGPFWQNLQHLTVTFRMRGPSGIYYFKTAFELRNSPWRSTESPSVDTLPPGSMPPGYDDGDAYLWRRYVRDRPQRRLKWDADEIRHIPNNEHLVPLLESFAQACVQIPFLRTASIETSTHVNAITDDGKPELRGALWAVCYLAPGTATLCTTKTWKCAG